MTKAARKWKQLKNPEVGSSKKRTSTEVDADNTIGSSEQRPPVNLDDYDDANPIPRSIKRKKTKLISSSSACSGSVSSHNDIGRAMVEHVSLGHLVFGFKILQAAQSAFFFGVNVAEIHSYSVNAPPIKNTRECKTLHLESPGAILRLDFPNFLGQIFDYESWVD
ncbi:unnamed protein product [Cuscuta campestris]|uniref:Uncharacterized protein n=1 Tax=Cuscuta campestris TaxID=132261 RepID=A0A484LEP8_9ASTE|nr:unnamed protein product [Cuscuta campestris]